MAIYEITHIYDEQYFRKDRKIIMVGENKQKKVLCESDFIDNICKKNANYCELTAIYALHKNVEDEFYGIEHYRRFFCDKYGKPISEMECKKIINEGKIILPIPCKLKPNIFLDYAMHHKIKDLECVRDIIMNDYNDYFNTFDAVMHSQELCCYNMIVCDSKIFNSYCSWLFELFEKLEKQVDLSSYSKYQARLYGFLSERLLNVWIKKNVEKERCVYRDVHMINNCTKENGMKSYLRTVKANLFI